MDSTHETICRLQKNVRLIGLALSFMSSNFAHCLLDFLKGKAGRSFSHTWSYIETKRKVCLCLAVVQALCYLCVCESLTRRECFRPMCPAPGSFYFLVTALHRYFSFSIWLFSPHPRVSGGGRASPALLGMNVMSD